MRLIVSEDDYTVTGDKALRRFAYGIASLDEKCERDWIVLLDKNERVTEILNNREKTKPRISFLNGRIYIIVEGVDEEVHYYFDIGDYEKINNQTKKSRTIQFGILSPDRRGVEYIIESGKIF